MSRKNKGLRTCLLCNKQFARQELVRLVKVNNTLIIDKDQNLPGRGYWIRLTDQSIKDPHLTSILSKRTKCSVDSDFIKELQQYEKTRKEK